MIEKIQNFKLNINERLTQIITKGNDSGPNLDEVQDSIMNVIKKVFGIATPIIMLLVAIFIIVKMSLIGIKIAKSADEPEERSKYVKAIIWWGVGLGVCILAATIVPSVIFGALGVE